MGRNKKKKNKQALDFWSDEHEGNKQDGATIPLSVPVRPATYLSLANL
jgi:hypothetical protein